MAQPATAPFDLNTYIIHHAANSRTWQTPLTTKVELPEPLSVHALMLLLCAGLVLFVFCALYRKGQKVPSGITNALEAVVLFIRDEIAIANLGPQDGRRLTPLFCTFFFFIVTMNLLGLVPGFASATGNINVTFALAMVSFGFMTLGAVARNGVGGFLNALINHELPLPVRIIVFLLEVLGLFVKLIALTIRLFANMMAGHMVIIVFLGLVLVLGLAALPSIALALLIYLLEIFVAFLQAYIFTMLSAVFIGQIYHPAH